MTVRELNREQLNQLKWSYFYQLRDDDDEQPFALKVISDSIDNYDYPEDIPDEIIFEAYGGIDFVKEDFGLEE